VDQLRNRLSRFQEILGDNTGFKTEQISYYIFRIST